MNATLNYALRVTTNTILSPIKLSKMALYHLNNKKELKTVNVHVRAVNRDDETSIDDILKIVELSNGLATACFGFKLNVLSARRISIPRLPKCSFTELFKTPFADFTNNAPTYGITLYFVDDIEASRGCVWPGTNWTLINTNRAIPSTIPHELFRMGGVLTHSKANGNIMSVGDGRTNATPLQMAALHSSKFIQAT